MKTRRLQSAALFTILLTWGAAAPLPLGAQAAISVDGVVEARAGGLQFPDGTIQTTTIAPGFAPVEKTGIEACWDAVGDPTPCAGTGQDGEVQRGVAWPDPRFTDNQDGTVTDNLTGLIWLKNANCITISPAAWSAALQNADQLSAGLCGLTDGSVVGDWRLPTVNELASLLDFAQPLAPFLPSGQPFQGVQTTYWSSSSQEALGSHRAWIVLPFGPRIQGHETTETGSVWPVRDAAPAPAPAQVEDTGQRECSGTDGALIPCSGTGQDGELQRGVDWPTPRFTDHGDGTVTDNLTGLIWLKMPTCPDIAEDTWTNALAKANDLSAGVCGLTDSSVPGDWRLPNIREMLSLIAWYRSGVPKLPRPSPFSLIPAPGIFWTSSSVVPAPSFGFVIDTFRGSVVLPGKEFEAAVWPIRGGS